MYKLLLSFALIGFSSSFYAQEAADKDVQAGLVLGFGMNFQKMGTKLMESNGVGTDLTIGANLNFSLTETIGFCTGVEFDFETLKYRAPAGDTIQYFYKQDDNSLIQIGDPTSNNLYQLTSRVQKPVYITIPTMLSFRTKFIGYFRYFGKFGLRTSILVSNKINDEGFNISPLDGSTINSEPNENMTAKGEMFPIKSAAGLSGGVEWNFTGSTCLVAEIGYYYGFTPLHADRKDTKAYLISRKTDPTTNVTAISSFSNQANQSQLMLKISILF